MVAQKFSIEVVMKLVFCKIKINYFRRKMFILAKRECKIKFIFVFIDYFWLCLIPGLADPSFHPAQLSFPGWHMTKTMPENFHKKFISILKVNIVL